MAVTRHVYGGKGAASMFPDFGVFETAEINYLLVLERNSYKETKVLRLKEILQSLLPATFVQEHPHKLQAGINA
jgi:hypothetical protein